MITLESLESSRVALEVDLKDLWRLVHSVDGEEESQVEVASQLSISNAQLKHQIRQEIENIKHKLHTHNSSKAHLSKLLQNQGSLASSPLVDALNIDCVHLTRTNIKCVQRPNRERGITRVTLGQNSNKRKQLMYSNRSVPLPRRQNRVFSSAAPKNETSNSKLNSKSSVMRNDIPRRFTFDSSSDSNCSTSRLNASKNSYSDQSQVTPQDGSHDSDLVTGNAGSQNEAGGQVRRRPSYTTAIENQTCSVEDVKIARSRSNSFQRAIQQGQITQPNCVKSENEGDTTPENESTEIVTWNRAPKYSSTPLQLARPSMKSVNFQSHPSIVHSTCNDTPDCETSDSVFMKKDTDPCMSLQEELMRSGAMQSRSPSSSQRLSILLEEDANTGDIESPYPPSHSGDSLSSTHLSSIVPIPKRSDSISSSVTQSHSGSLDSLQSASSPRPDGDKQIKNSSATKSISSPHQISSIQSSTSQHLSSIHGSSQSDDLHNSSTHKAKSDLPLEDPSKISSGSQSSHSNKSSATQQTSLRTNSASSPPPDEFSHEVWTLSPSDSSPLVSDHSPVVTSRDSGHSSSLCSLEKASPSDRKSECGVSSKDGPEQSSCHSDKSHRPAKESPAQASAPVSPLLPLPNPPLSVLRASPSYNLHCKTAGNQQGTPPTGDSREPIQPLSNGDTSASSDNSEDAKSCTEVSKIVKKMRKLTLDVVEPVDTQNDLKSEEKYDSNIGRKLPKIDEREKVRQEQTRYSNERGLSPSERILLRSSEKRSTTSPKDAESRPVCLKTLSAAPSPTSPVSKIVTSPASDKTSKESSSPCKVVLSIDPAENIVQEEAQSVDTPKAVPKEDTTGSKKEDSLAPLMSISPIPSPPLSPRIDFRKEPEMKVPGGEMQPDSNGTTQDHSSKVVGLDEREPDGAGDQSRSVSALSIIRQSHLAKRRDHIRQNKMPQLSELAEKDGGEENGVASSGTDSPTKNDTSLPLLSNGDAIMPSIPDEYLQKLGLNTEGEEEEEKNSDELSDQEIESKFSSLSLAFKTDGQTLEKRLEIQERSRDIAEQNVDKELQALRSCLATLHKICTDPQVRELLAKIQTHIDILEKSTARVSSRAEVFGAIQQEKRMSKAVDIMVHHVENIRRVHEKEHAELEEARKLLQDSRSLAPSSISDLTGSGDILSRRSASVCPNNAFTGKASRRRVSEIALPKVLGGAGVQNLHPSSSMDARSRFQAVVASATVKSAVANTLRRASLEKQSNVQSVTPTPTPPQVSRDNSSDSSKVIELQDKEKQKNMEEEAFKKGYEQGLRASLGRDLSSLREQQNTINESLGAVMDTIDNDMEEPKGLKEIMLQHFNEGLPKFTISGWRIRMTFGCFFIVMAILSVIVSLFPGGSAEILGYENCGQPPV